MELVFKKSNKINRPFIAYLLNTIKVLLRLKIIRKSKKLKVLDDYMHDNGIIPKDLKCKDILIQALSTMVLVNLEDVYIISINKNIKIRGKYKLYELCKFINYGNLEVSGVPIIIEVFNHIADNFYVYLSRYKKMFRISI
jgi:serine/threonine protein kinase